MLKLSTRARTSILFFSTFLLLTTKSFSESKLCEGVVNYQVKKDKKSVYGALNCKGSTNVGAFLNIWVPEFQKLYPSVTSSMSFQGSSDAIQGLIDGTVSIGATSRSIQKKELSAFKELKGYAPTEIKVSLDALAIYVNRLNKLDTITLEELDAIFSTERKRGYPKSIETWETFTRNPKKINIYLFDKNSGTRSYFKKRVLLKSDYNNKNIISEEFTTTTQVVNEVAKDVNGICFGSVGVENFKVKALSLAKRKNFPIHAPTDNNIRHGDYPLSRFFYIYLDVPPDKPIPKLLYEFCKFILSYEGQTIAVRAGGLSLSPKQIGIELSKMRRK
jgi:phosphate transport system substrate-binding protein